MLDRISRNDSLSSNEIEFLISVIEKKQIAVLLKFIYYAQESDIVEAMDLFASLTVVPRMKAMQYLLALKGKFLSEPEYA